MRNLRIDLDALTEALTWGDELDTFRHFLDAETGEVVLASTEDLELVEEGQPERAEDPELATAIVEGWGERYRVVDRLDSRESYQHMVEFIQGLPDGKLRWKLETAIEGRGAFRRFKDVLLDFPADRERWFDFQRQALHQVARRWLQGEGINLVES